jgi:hypothetical protein
MQEDRNGKKLEKMASSGVGYEVIGIAQLCLDNVSGKFVLRAGGKRRDSVKVQRVGSV